MLVQPSAMFERGIAADSLVGVGESTRLREGATPGKGRVSGTRVSWCVAVAPALGQEGHQKHVIVLHRGKNKWSRTILSSRDTILSVKVFFFRLNSRSRWLIRN